MVASFEGGMSIAGSQVSSEGRIEDTIDSPEQVVVIYKGLQVDYGPCLWLKDVHSLHASVDPGERGASGNKILSYFHLPQASR